MLAFGIIEQLNVFEDISPGFLARPVFPASDLFSLQELKEALSDSIVMAIAASAHRVFHIVVAQEGGPFAAGELRTLIRMDQQAGPGLSSPDRHQQRLHGKF